MEKIIAGKRITLMPYRECDREDLIALLTDEHICKTYMMPPLESKQARNAMADRLIGVSHDDAHFERGIYVGGKLIGFVNDVETGADAIELGYAVSPAFEGRGYAGEALCAAAEALFAAGFKRIAACAFEENEASFAVMRKCGMRPTGAVKQIEYRGVMHECPCYAIEK